MGFRVIRPSVRDGSASSLAWATWTPEAAGRRYRAGWHGGTP